MISASLNPAATCFICSRGSGVEVKKNWLIRPFVFHRAMSSDTFLAFVNLVFSTMRSEWLNALCFTQVVVLSFNLTPANCFSVSTAVVFEVSADFPFFIALALCSVSATTGDFNFVLRYIFYSLVVSAFSLSALSTSFKATLSIGCDSNTLHHLIIITLIIFLRLNGLFFDVVVCQWFLNYICSPPLTFGFYDATAGCVFDKNAIFFFNIVHNNILCLSLTQRVL